LHGSVLLSASSGQRNFARKYRGTIADHALSVSFDDDGWSVIKPYVAESKMNYRVLLGTEDMPKTYWDVQAIPTTYLIDRQGRIAITHTGLVSKQTYEEGILKLLAGS